MNMLSLVWSRSSVPDKTHSLYQRACNASEFSLSGCLQSSLLF